MPSEERRLTLHARLDDVERVDDQDRHGPGREAGDGLDESGRAAARMFRITHRECVGALYYILRLREKERLRRGRGSEQETPGRFAYAAVPGSIILQ